MKNAKLAAALMSLALTGVSGTVSAQDAKESKVGAWTLRTISDPITDESRVIAVLEGTNGSLAIKCDSPSVNSVYIHFITGEYLGSGRSARRNVVQRFDDNAPLSTQWYHDGRGAILTNNRDVAAFIGSLVNSSRVVIRAQTYQFSDVTALFDVASSDALAAVRQVYDGCRDNWPLG